MYKVRMRAIKRVNQRGLSYSFKTLTNIIQSLEWELEPNPPGEIRAIIAFHKTFKSKEEVIENRKVIEFHLQLNQISYVIDSIKLI